MSSRIAVVGMGCVYPGALSPEELWENVVSGRRYFRTLPSNRMPVEDYFSDDPSAPRRTYSKQMAVIDGWQFDPLQFNIPPVTFNATDIAHWLALWACDKAIKDARLDLPNIQGEKVGVVIGNSMTGEFFRTAVLQFRWAYVERTIRRSLASLGVPAEEIELILSNTKEHYERPLPKITEDSLAGNMSNTIAGRICHQFNFGGSGYTVDGACSSSLLAVSQACELLENNELDIVVAGGVDVSLDPFEVVGFAKTKALAKNDIRPYDETAEGMLPGEGCGFVVLMREDFAKRNSYQSQAVICGWGHSTDGRSSGITAPVAEGQMRAIAKAYKRAGYPITTVDLFEGHGTGTALGDKVEITALRQLLEEEQKDDKHLHWLGSIKGNIGHCKAAAGVAGLIKAIMALRNKVIPPSVSCQQPNMAFGRPLGVLRPTTRGTVWEKRPDQPRRASVSAMGFGGSNAHITLEESTDSSPLQSGLDVIHSGQTHELVCLSAESVKSLKEQLARILEIAQQICRAELTDLSAALAKNVPSGKYRIAFVSDAPWDLVKQIEYVLETGKENIDIGALDSPERGIFASAIKEDPKIVALFPGQAAQRLNMGEAFIRRYPFVREFYERVESHIADIIHERLRSVMLVNTYSIDDNQRAALEQRISDTKLAQPSIIAASIATLKILNHFGIKPEISLGHSLGEIAALHTAGVFDDVTAVRIAALRGEIMGSLPVEEAGAMLAVMASADDVRALMNETGLTVHISNYNSARQTVISDAKERVKQFADILQDRNIPCKVLNVSRAFHSQYVAAAEIPFLQSLRHLKFSKLNGAAVISTMTGKAYDDTSDIYMQLANQIVQPVRFIKAMESAAKENPDMWIEVGPGATLSQFAKDTLGGIECFATNTGGEDGSQLINNILARAFVIGYPVRLDNLFANRFSRPFDVENYRPETITNPCERPYEFPEVTTTHGSVINEGYQSLRPSGVKEEDFSHYLASRGDYIKDVIALDLKYASRMAPEQVLDLVKEEKVLRNKAAVSPEPSKPKLVYDSSTQSSLQKSSDADLLKFVLDWVMNRTGFPEETVKPQKRLRDDLNLDSIKVGELAIAISQQFNIQYNGDPAELANSTIESLVHQFEQCVVPQSPDANVTNGAQSLTPDEQVTTISPLDFVVQWIAERTGYPIETINPQKRLRDDLNLDSIKVGELAIALSQHFNVDIEDDPSALANTTIEKFVENMRLEKREVNVQPVVESAPQSINSYAMDFQPCPLEQEEAGLSLRNRHGVIVSSECVDVAEAVKAELQSSGARISLATIADFPAVAVSADFLVVLVRSNGGVFTKTLEDHENRQQYSDAGELYNVLHLACKAVDFAKCKTLVVDLEDQSNTMMRAGAAILKTLRLEYGDTMKWITLPVNEANTVIASTVCAELETAGQHIGYFYQNQIRYAEIAGPYNLPPASASPVTKGDVVLVTGGAKGITAELAFALAESTGATLALMGSSPVSDPEVSDTLQRFTAAGIPHQYYQCNVTDAEAVKQTIADIRDGLGNIGGFFHGAGVSGLQPFTQLTYDEFMRCFNVKAMGFANVLQNLPLADLKLVHVISSIIGKMGMQGQADYAFANAWLDEAVRAISSHYPHIHCLALGFSVWSGTGLGHKLGVVDSLARQGVSAISPEEGISTYVKLLKANHTSPVYVVTGSLPASHRQVIMRSHPGVKGRFLENIIEWVPGREIVVETTINHKIDRYIAEHVYQGTPLMPGVMAIEAMTQTVMACRDNSRRPSRIKDVVFYRPLILPFDSSTKVKINARQQQESSDAYAVELYANNIKYYSAIFEFGGDALHASAPVVAEPIPISAESYNPYPLFQGKFFRRIENLYQLNKGVSVISEIRVPTQDELSIFLPEDIDVSAVVRDAFLQTGALALPNGYLPASIEAFYVNSELPQGEMVLCECRIKSGGENRKLADISIFSKQGKLLEKMESIELRIAADARVIQHSFFEPAAIDTVVAKHASRLTRYGVGLRLQTHQEQIDPAALVSDEEISALEQRVSPPRFKTSLYNTLAAKKALRDIRSTDADTMTLLHDTDGKPSFAMQSESLQKENNAMHVSLADMDGLSLALVAKGPVGADLEIIQERDAKSWLYLLGSEDYRAAEALTYQTGEPYDWSATRMWTIKEALQKAGMDARRVNVGAPVLNLGWYEAKFEYDTNQYLMTSCVVNSGQAGQKAVVTLVFPDTVEQNPQPILLINESADAVKRIESCLDQFESQLQMGSSEFAQDPDTELVEHHQHYVYHLLEETLNTLRAADPELSKEDTKRLQTRGYDLIHRYGILSNVFYRVLEKPFGYPGDHVLLDRMFRNEVTTSGIGYHLDRFFQSYPGTEAVRQRTYWVVRKLEQFLCEQGRSTLKILDLGAGPMAIERTLSQRYNGKLSVTSLDFDSNSFDYAISRFDKEVEFHTEQQNLVSPEGIRRIREVAAEVDVVCSMGLIEYLGEDTVVSILGAIYDGIKPGTQVFTSNYVPGHCSQTPMEWFMDWWLVYRPQQKMAELATLSGFRSEEVELCMDPTNSITLMKLTKH